MKTMKQYLKIESKGEIEPKSFYLIGASTKRDNLNKIGKFGSGLKYAIAWFLRNNIDLHVFSGYRKINISTVKEQFKDKTFDVICINGEKTSITTEMGPDWKGWMAIREIIANAIDESEYSISITDEKNVIPVEDKTCFYIEIKDEIKDVLQSWERYFLYPVEGMDVKKKPLAIVKNGDSIVKIYQKENPHDKTKLYKEGFLVSEDDVKGIFDYEYNDIALNEMRKAEYPFSTISRITREIMTSDNDSAISLFIKTLVTADMNAAEWDTDFCPSKQVYDFFVDKCIVDKRTAGYFKEEIERIPVHKLYYLQDKFYFSIVKNIPQQYKDKITILGAISESKEETFYKPCEDKTTKMYIEKALETLKQCEYDVRFPYQIVEFLDVNVLGMADTENKTILLSKELKNKGLFKTIQVIIEENEHIITKYDDETRELQTRFLELYTKELLLRHNIIL